MSVASTIKAKLHRALTPEHLSVVDESAQHHGHAGWRPGGETHFRVEIVAAAFAGKSRVTRERMVHRILADELAGGVHALSVRTGVPE